MENTITYENEKNIFKSEKRVFDAVLNYVLRSQRIHGYYISREFYRHYPHIVGIEVVWVSGGANYWNTDSDKGRDLIKKWTKTSQGNFKTVHEIVKEIEKDWGWVYQDPTDKSRGIIKKQIAGIAIITRHYNDNDNSFEDIANVYVNKSIFE